MESTNQINPDQPRLLDEHGIARFLGVSTALVRKDRYGARHIPFMRIRTSVRYDPDRVMQAMLALEEGGNHMKRATRKRNEKEMAVA